MLFVVFYLILLSNRFSISPDLSQIFAPFDYGYSSSIWIGPAVLLIVLLVLSIYTAVLVAAASTKAGPMRLLLAGLLVPALACNIVMVTWNFGA